MINIVKALVMFILELAKGGKASQTLVDKVKVDDLTATVMALVNAGDNERIVDKDGISYKIKEYDGIFLTAFKSLFVPRKVSLTQDATKDLVEHEMVKVGSVLSPTDLNVQMKLIAAAARGNISTETITVSDLVAPTTIQNQNVNLRMGDKLTKSTGMPVRIRLSGAFEDWEGYDYREVDILNKMKVDILK